MSRHRGVYFLAGARGMFLLETLKNTGIQGLFGVSACSRSPLLLYEHATTYSDEDGRGVNSLSV